MKAILTDAVAVGNARPRMLFDTRDDRTRFYRTGAGARRSTRGGYKFDARMANACWMPARCSTTTRPLSRPRSPIEARNRLGLRHRAPRFEGATPDVANGKGRAWPSDNSTSTTKLVGQGDIALTMPLTLGRTCRHRLRCRHRLAGVEQVQTFLHVHRHASQRDRGRERRFDQGHRSRDAVAMARQ